MTSFVSPEVSGGIVTVSSVLGGNIESGLTGSVDGEVPAATELEGPVSLCLDGVEANLSLESFPPSD